MTFAQAVESALKNFAKFTGLASRTEFWYFRLFAFLVSIVTSVLDGILFPVDANAPIQDQLLGQPIGLVTSLLLLLPDTSVLARRFRDAGFSAKWLFLFVPVLGFMVLVGFAAQAVQDMGQSGTLEGDLNVIGFAVPGILISFGIGIFFLIVTLQPTKTGAQGNKYAPDYDPTRDPKSDQFAGNDQGWQPKL